MRTYSMAGLIRKAAGMWEKWKISGNNTELTVRTFGRLNTEDEFNNLIIKNINGADIRLKDVGEAVLGPENEESILRGDGIPMID